MIPQLDPEQIYTDHLTVQHLFLGIETAPVVSRPPHHRGRMNE